MPVGFGVVLERQTERQRSLPPEVVPAVRAAAGWGARGLGLRWSRFFGQFRGEAVYSMC